MRILVITRNAWDDTNAIGNTLSNFFAGVEGIDFASIYFRSASPSNRLCSEYFCVTETEVIKKWFIPKRIGKRFTYIPYSAPALLTATQKNERWAVRFVRDHKLRLIYWASNCIWYSKKWQNENLSNFVQSFSPDLVVTFVKSAPQYYLTVKYLREKFNIPVFSWIADDEYTGLKKEKSRRAINNLKYIIKESAVVRGCSQNVCDYYNAVFGCKATPLYKGCDLSTPVKNYVNEPLKVIYAGNLLYGRLEIIRKVSEIIESFDSTREKVIFEIYSNSLLPCEEEAFFKKKRCTKYLGCLEYDEIKRKLAAADVVLHVESFEETQILKTRFSFSTKITDYLQSGSVVLAIGPNEVASIEYMKKIPGTCVIDCLEDLEIRLIDFLKSTEYFCERCQSIREFAKKNHDQVRNAKELEALLNDMKEGESCGHMLC